MTMQAKEMVKGIAKLASLPEVCVRVNEMVDDPRCSAGALQSMVAATRRWMLHVPRSALASTRR